MNQKMVFMFSVLTSTALFIGLSMVFSGAPNSLDLSHINPLEAINGLAFSFAFGLGLSEWASFILAGLILFGLPIALFSTLKHWLGRRLKQ